MKGNDMSISAVNCTPIKPQVSFGKLNNVEDVERLMDKSLELSDSFTKTDAPEKKGVIGTLVSLATAAGLSALGALALAKKGISIFPEFPAKAENVIRKAANRAKNIAANLAAKDNKILKTIGSKAGEVENFARNVYKDVIRKESGAAGVVEKAAVALGLLGFFPKVATVDANKDGIADISQKNVNAYKGAIEKLGVVSDIVTAVS